MIHNDEVDVILDAIDDYASVHLLVEAMIPMVESTDYLEQAMQRRTREILRRLDVDSIITTVTGDVQQVRHVEDDTVAARRLTDGYFGKAVYLHSLKYREDIGWRGVP